MPKRDDLKKIMLIGSGPIVIGQACEFDYSGVQACKALQEEGYEVVLVNSNPATIMTDPDFADRTYIEPLTKDILHEIIRRERPTPVSLNGIRSNSSALTPIPSAGQRIAICLKRLCSNSDSICRYQVPLTPWRRLAKSPR